MERLPNGAMSEEEFIELFGEEAYQYLPQNRLIQLNKKYYVVPLKFDVVNSNMNVSHSFEMDQYFFWDWTKSKSAIEGE